MSRLYKSALLFSLIALSVLGTAAPGSAQKDAPKDMLPLSLEAGSVSILRMINWVALNEGIYKKDGLDVTQCMPPGTLVDLKALGVDGPSDYLCKPAAAANLPRNAVAGEVAEGELNIPITLVGGTPTVLGQTMDPKSEKRIIIQSSSNTTHWMIFGRKGITSLEQLKGGRIGVLSYTDIHGYMALSFADAMGWDPRNDITLVLGSGGAAFRNLESGKVDGIVANEVAQWLALKAGYKPLVDMADWKLPMASASANVDAAWLQKNRETARRFVKAMVDARALMEHDPGTFNRAIAKYYNITDPKMQAHFYAGIKFLPRKPYPGTEGIRKAFKLYNVPVMYRPEAYVDDSFVRELDQSGYIDSLYK